MFHKGSGQNKYVSYRFLIVFLIKKNVFLRKPLRGFSFKTVTVIFERMLRTSMPLPKSSCFPKAVVVNQAQSLILGSIST